jgi:transcriptional regulator with XRE-family HTH domain
MKTSGSIGSKIRRVRELRGVKQEVLADRIGVNVRSVVLWELSDTLERDTLEGVAAGLDLHPDFIDQFDERAFIAHCIKMQVL